MAEGRYSDGVLSIPMVEVLYKLLFYKLLDLPKNTATKTNSINKINTKQEFD